MSDTFTNLKSIIKLHIHVENVPIRIDVQEKPSYSVIAYESHTCDRPLGLKYKNPRKRSVKNETIKESHEEIQDRINVNIPKGVCDPESQLNEELSINSS